MILEVNQYAVSLLPLLPVLSVAVSKNGILLQILDSKGEK